MLGLLLVLLEIVNGHGGEQACIDATACLDCMEKSEHDRHIESPGSPHQHNSIKNLRTNIVADAVDAKEDALSRSVHMDEKEGGKCGSIMRERLNDAPSPTQSQG